MSGLVLPFSASRAADDAPAGRGFKSYKSDRPIPYTRRVSRDALIQATLEPEISELAPLKGSHGAPADAFFLFVVTTQGQRCAIALSDRSNGVMFDPPAGCDAAVAICIDSILAEPILTTSRMIWSRREEIVPPAFMVKLLRRLGRSENGERLADLEDVLTEDPIKWVDYTMALACRGLVSVDYRNQLTDATIVRLGPVARENPSNGLRSAHWLDQ